MVKISKMIKLTRLFRVLKIIKERSKIVKYVQDFLKLSRGFERLFFFMLSFLMVVHITATLWIVFKDLSTKSNLDDPEMTME